MKGSYILLIKLDEDKELQIGKLGNISFKKGYYVYVGSALNGLEQRINRHLRDKKKIYWHIDYFLENAKIVDIRCRESNQREECKIARSFSKLEHIDNFGCSDCKCKTHLFYGSKNEFIKTIEYLNMIKYF